jgi:chorismate mutase/prephenate dehydratase
MDILDRAIETDKRNYTRFLVVGKKAAAPAGECKTSVVFRIKHVAGSLYKAIGCFANNGINLTYIQSRPAAGRPWEYSFFVDMEGSSSDKSVRKALEELKSYALFVKVLGSYKAAKNPALPR